jgi:hypothetical protein
MRRLRVEAHELRRLTVAAALVNGRSSHLSTFRFNAGIFCGIRWVVALTKTAQVELESVHFSAQRRQFLWDTVGGCTDENGSG